MSNRTTLENVAKWNAQAAKTARMNNDRRTADRLYAQAKHLTEQALQLPQDDR